MLALLFLSLAWQTASRPLATDERRAVAVDVPLALMPGGPDLGVAVAASFLDYDGDGWIDLYLHNNGGLWHNEVGTGFRLAANLHAFLPRLSGNYGTSCGDLDGDGLPEIACEPRGDCFYLLKNLDGAGHFVEIARNPALVLDPPGCRMLAETFCWADVDEDGDLDLWTPAYPDSVSAGSGGNHFFENLGPTGPGGAHRLARRTLESGLGNPPGVSKPEGAQFADADRDGDLDAYTGGTLYQNVTATDGARFRPLVGAPTGITPDRLDEGALLLDYDLDGDQDLFVLYLDSDCTLWENEGDGTFFLVTGVIESPGTDLDLGCSAEDWDLDGDLDLTTADTFRRNMLVETGERRVRLAVETLPSSILLSPAWGDWDEDGDPDCILQNFQGRNRVFLNSTYGPDTQPFQNLSVRVRPVRDSATIARGLETEFGATVEVRVHEDASGLVRRRFVASSHGYLQQSEYALTFGLPPGPDPQQPALGVRFDLLVDFPSLPRNGIVRIDRDVNPVLGDLLLADLAEREITVFRSGLVRIDGVELAPRASVSTRLFSSGALVLPEPGLALAEPVLAPEANWVVGMELDTLGASGAVRVEELVLDGQLAPPDLGRCNANVVLLDVTERTPLRVFQEDRTTSPRNDRTFLALDWVLKPQRVYRVLCRVSELRDSPLADATGTELANHGALAFARENPCDDALAARAALVPSTSYLELRYRPTTATSPPP